MVYRVEEDVNKCTNRAVKAWEMVGHMWMGRILESSQSAGTSDLSLMEWGEFQQLTMAMGRE